MPLYTFKCDKCQAQRDYLTTYGTKVVKCVECEGEAHYQPSYMSNATGLPNGSAANRSKSRIKKNNGGANNA